MGFFSLAITLLEGKFIDIQSRPAITGNLESGLNIVNPWSYGVGCFYGIEPGFVELFNVSRLRRITDKMGDTMFLFELLCQGNPILINRFSGLVTFSQEIGSFISINAIDLDNSWI